MWLFGKYFSESDLVRILTFIAAFHNKDDKSWKLKYNDFLPATTE